MTTKNYDVIIIGAGSVGVPTSMELASENLSVLVIDRNPSVGQGQNKAAIGGIRATFSDPGKIQVCLESLNVLSTWKEKYGVDIGWRQGGYCFPVYSEEVEIQLKNLLKVQKKYGLNIDWIDAEALKKLVPGINPENLRGGTFSPEDGNVSPLLTINAVYQEALKKGVEFHFNEEVTGIVTEKGKITGVKTVKDTYNSPVVILAAGAEAKDVGKTAGIEIPVFPDTHEAGITEGVESFFSPMVVDLRTRPGSGNFYFYQNYRNQILFSLTPDPLEFGKDRKTTSGYLPMVAKRLIEVMPRLKNIRIRRTWRGLYPMTPDGIPIVDKVKEVEGLYLTVGLCGQGLMLGPGIARNMASLIIKGKPLIDEEVFREFSFYRSYKGKTEILK